MVLKQAPADVLSELEDRLGLSSNDLARALGVSRRTLDRWRTGETYPQREARRRLHALVEVQRHLADTFTTIEAGRSWLHEPDRYLGGLSPADALRVGRIERVEGALEALDSGAFV